MTAPRGAVVRKTYIVVAADDQNPSLQQRGLRRVAATDFRIKERKNYATASFACFITNRSMP